MQSPSVSRRSNTLPLPRGGEYSALSSKPPPRRQSSAVSQDEPDPEIAELRSTRRLSAPAPTPLLTVKPQVPTRPMIAPVAVPRPRSNSMNSQPRLMNSSTATAGINGRPAMPSSSMSTRSVNPPPVARRSATLPRPAQPITSEGTHLSGKEVTQSNSSSSTLLMPPPVAPRRDIQVPASLKSDGAAKPAIVPSTTATQPLRIGSADVLRPEARQTVSSEVDRKSQNQVPPMKTATLPRKKPVPLPTMAKDSNETPAVTPSTGLDSSPNDGSASKEPPERSALRQSDTTVNAETVPGGISATEPVENLQPATVMAGTASVGNQNAGTLPRPVGMTIRIASQGLAFSKGLQSSDRTAPARRRSSTMPLAKIFYSSAPATVPTPQESTNTNFKQASSEGALLDDDTKNETVDNTSTTTDAISLPETCDMARNQLEVQESITDVHDTSEQLEVAGDVTDEKLGETPTEIDDELEENDVFLSEGEDEPRELQFVPPPRAQRLSRTCSDERRIATAEQMATDNAMKRIRDKMRKELLNSYREDLSEWITQLTGKSISNEEDEFFDALADGVLLCKVAQIVGTAENEHIKATSTEKNPTLWRLPHCNTRALKGTFVARDNIHAFIMFSRGFGVPESAIFETEDLVAGKKLKNVLYTLMDLARLSHLTGERLPQLIQLEREIDNEIIEEHNEADMMLYSPPPRVKPPLPPKPLGLSLVPKQVSEIACGPEETDVTPPTFERSSLGRLSESTEDDNDGVCADEEPQELHSTCFDVPEPIESSEIGLGLRRQSSGLIVVPVADVAPCPQPAEVKVIFPTTTATSQCGVTQTMAIQCDLDEATNDIEQNDGVAEPASLEVSQSATLDISPDGRAQEAATPSPMPNTESAVTSTVKGVESVSTETGMMTIDMPESHEDTPAEMPSVPEAVAPAVKEETTVAEPVHKVQQVPMNVKFVKGDEIDEAVQIMSNQYGGRVKLKRVRKGKYEVANSRRNLFVRILRNHIMVRVGGGWDTLEHYLLTHQPEASHLSQALLGAAARNGDHTATASALRSQAEAVTTTSSNTSKVFTPGSKQDHTGQIKVLAQNSPKMANVRSRGSKPDLLSPFRRSSSAALLNLTDSHASPNSRSGTPVLSRRSGSRASLGLLESVAPNPSDHKRDSTTLTQGVFMEGVTPLGDEDPAASDTTIDTTRGTKSKEYALKKKAKTDENAAVRHSTLRKKGSNEAPARAFPTKGRNRKGSFAMEPPTPGQAAARARLKAATTDWHKSLHKKATR